MCLSVNRRSGFTLIELLVVIAIIAILAVVVVLTLNPAELLRQSRDSNRLSDMTNLTSAVNLYTTDQAGASSFNMGSSSVVYVSIPDPQATSTVGTNCATMGLLSLPAGYTYHCAASSTYRNVNGTGWIPINLSNITSGAPMSDLPVDPINSSSSRFYYTYETNGTQFEVTMVPESQKYKLGGSSDVVSGDGGTLASVYEKGNIFGLEPLDYGDSAIVGYWTFNEGTGSVVYDYSGNNAAGSWNGTLGSQWTAGKIGPYAGNFVSSSANYVSTTFQYSLNGSSNFSWTTWIYFVSAGSSNTTLIGDRAGSTWIKVTPSAFEVSGGIISYALPTSTWNFVAVTKSGNSFVYYDNNVVVGTATSGNSVTNIPFYIGGDPAFPSDGYMTGKVDDVRLYSRTLSAAEVAALYNGGK